MRINGDTTRRIDSKIQDLFSGKEVNLIDEPNTAVCNDRLGFILRRRLKLEHPNVIQYLKTTKMSPTWVCIQLRTEYFEEILRLRLK